MNINKTHRTAVIRFTLDGWIRSCTKGSVGLAALNSFLARLDETTRQITRIAISAAVIATVIQSVF